MMDSLRGQTDLDGDDIDDYGAIEAPPMFQSAERRMHVRAYNYWVSLLGNRALPSIEDLNPEETEDFSANSVLLDFSMGLENPAILYLGSALREECGITGPIERVADVPPRSLLTRLTDHYLQIIANAAPVGFEAEFVNQRDANILYRGILMPFSSDDETIDFIYGVINWREAVSDSMNAQLDAEMHAALAGVSQHSEAPIWAEGPSATSDFLGDDDFGFDEEPESARDDMAPAAAIAEPIADLAADPLDLAGFLDEAPVDDSLSTEPPLDDPLGSLDDLLSLPEAESPLEEAAPDALDLAAYMLPEAEQAAENETATVEPETGTDLDAAFDLDDLLGELEAGQSEPEALAEPEEQPASEAALEELPDLDDILGELDSGAMDAAAPAPPAPEEARELDLDDLLGDIGLDEVGSVDAPYALHEMPLPQEPETAFVPAFADIDALSEEQADASRLQDEADLADLLAEARSSAAEVLDCDARSRTALYRAIGRAHDFALSAQASPADYAEMLADAGIVAQERSPMTAVIKLVFGADYDKTRIAEYALALDYANSTGLSQGELGELLGVYKGGLKGLVQQMRASRSGETETPAVRSRRRLERAARKLQKARATDAAGLPFSELGLAVVIARREEDGSISLVSGVGLEDKSAQKVLIAASKSLRRKPVLG